MSKNNPLVSVVITSYNQRNKLKRAIDSVLAQTYKNIQIVIADDCSTKDDSVEMLYEYKKNYPDKIKLVLQEKNVGIPKNRNAGFKVCDGDYTTYLDGDDFYYKDKIRTELETFSKNKWADIVYSNFTFTDFEIKRNKKWAKSSFKPKEGNIFEDIYTRNFPRETLYRCELMKADVMKSINYYDGDLKIFEDWDCRIRMTKKFKVAFNNTLGSAYVQDPSGISKLSEDEFLINGMKNVVAKNEDLLNDLDNKEDILRKIDKMFLFTRANISLDLQKSCNYFLRYPFDIKSHKLVIRSLLNKVALV